MFDQKGLGALELMLGAIVLTLLAVWGTGALVTRMDESAARSSAVWMLSVRQALHSYLERYAPTIAYADSANALAVQGYTDWSSPQLHELKADMLLSQGFPETVTPGSGASIKVIRSGLCPGPACHVEGLVHSKTPFLKRKSSEPDEYMIAQWLMSSKGWGAWVRPGAPDFIQGRAFQFSNPAWPGGALPSGSVAMAVTREHLREFDYLRVGDLRNPDFRADVDVAGGLQVGTDLDVRRYLHLETAGALAQACPREGVLTRSAQTGLLMCRAGTWKPATRAGGGGFSLNDVWGCANNRGVPTSNPLTRACTCPPATSVVQISDSGPQDFPEGRTLGYLCVE